MRMIAIALLVGVLGSALMAADKAGPPEPAGMVQLFNGKDLTGWDGDPQLWSVKDGVLRGETTPENPAKGNTFIVWKGNDQVPATLKDFELRLSFRVAGTNNSGVQYRSKHITDAKNNKWVVRGYQAEVRNETKLPNTAGFIYDEGGKRGRLALVGEKVVWENGKKNVVGKVGDVDAFLASIKPDGWNDYVIIAKGNNIQQFVNGIQTVDFTDNEPQLALQEGIIALQLHAGKPMWVEFKDVRVKKID